MESIRSHSEPEYRDAYGGRPHADTHRGGYEHSHIDPDCHRYKYPNANIHPNAYPNPGTVWGVSGRKHQ